ncbi:MAG TPA: AraC family transcriptional regulator [Ruminiclostridium sp.]|nr:AraC family transcriptional regulator [Ruminiclostridium sp.]
MKDFAARDLSLYEKFEVSGSGLPIVFHKDRLYRDGEDSFSRHWHEKMEFLYFIKGNAVIGCNGEQINACAGNMVVINSNELHEGHALSEFVEYYCLIVDTSLFQDRKTDICEAKYIKPIYQNCIVFKNKIENDSSIKACIENIVREIDSKDTGFEIAVKAAFYQLMVILLRNHVKYVLTPNEYDKRMHTLNRLNTVLEYIENNYRENITLEKLSSMANLSRYHFCHLFRKTTGKTLSEYLNAVRIGQAEKLIMEGDTSITEAALSCGYNDANYFSRVYKKYKNIAPSKVKETISSGFM